MTRCAHSLTVPKTWADDEPLIDPEEVNEETSPWDLDNRMLIAALEGEAYNVYEMGACPCRLNECRKALLHRLGDTQ